ncbi:hypothetical protein KR018_004456, partial [Drosophila ironensis]
NEPPTQPLTQQQQRTPLRASGSLELTPLPPPPTSLEIREHRDRQQRGAQAATGEELQRSKQSLKGSRVSFERRDTGNSNNSNSKQAESSDED